MGHWVDSGGKKFLYVCDYTHQFLIDPTAYKHSDLTGQIELYSPNAPDALSLPVTLNEDGNGSWQVAMKGKLLKELDVRKTRLTGDLDSFDSVTISPDGQQVAYVTDNG